MHDGPSQNGHAALSTSAGITQDLNGRHQKTGNLFRGALLLFGALLVLGIVGFFLRLRNGFDDPSVWGYHAGAFVFILTTAQGALMVAIAPRIAKAHWCRPISRAAAIQADHPPGVIMEMDVAQKCETRQTCIFRIQTHPMILPR